MTTIIQGEKPYTEDDIIKSIKNAIKTKSHNDFESALEDIEIKKVSNKLFFHKGVLLHLVALHCDIKMLKILKNKYMFCNPYLGMPRISSSMFCKRFDEKILSGEIIFEEKLKQIPKENLKWLIGNDYLNEMYG